jgi:hypothetical protein
VISIVGAGGKMGTRTTDNLSKEAYRLLLCENSPSGIEMIRDKGMDVVEAETALPQSDVVIMAIPDRVIGIVANQLVPLLKPDAIFILLDPAAAYLGEVPLRDDCTYIVSHPCHPAFFSAQDSLSAYQDYFGGTAAKQDIVIALLHGNESNFSLAQTVCSQMFGRVQHCHRITVEQMALLEPAAAEVVAGSALSIIREATAELIRRGVPEAAARAFVLGHMQVIGAVLFDQTEFPVSDAAKIAIEIGREYLIKPEWKKVFEPNEIKKMIERMIHPT